MLHNLLVLDYRSDAYATRIRDLAARRVSEECFRAMPREYRRIELGGLPFAGGLAERVITTDDGGPLIMRLSMAAVGVEAETFSYTDVVANCTALGAPNLVANLFASEIASEEETAALEQLAPVLDICSRNGSAIEAAPLAMRSMLATASFRILAAQDTASHESEDDA